jgi:hypothetical protein
MSEQNTTSPPINVEALAEKFVALRDKIKDIKDRHKDELAPYNESLEQLSAYILDYLNQVNVDSMRTGAGTVTRSHKDSCSVADMDAFWTFVVTQGNFDLCDRKANVTAVRDYMEKNSAPVPGVNFSSMQTVSVRRASTTK